MAMVTGASVVVPGELLAPVPKFCVPRPQFRCAMIVLEVGSEMSAPGVVCFWVSFVSGDNAAVPGEGLASEDARGSTGCDVARRVPSAEELHCSQTSQLCLPRSYGARFPPSPPTIAALNPCTFASRSSNFSSLQCCELSGAFVDGNLLALAFDWIRERPCLCCGLVFLIGKFSGGFGVRCSTVWNSFRIGVVRLRFGLWRKVGSGVAGARGGFFCLC